MKQYKELVKEIKEKGTHKAPAREGMPGSLSRFGYQFRHELNGGENFPLLTTKKLSFKSIVAELLWFLRGDTNIKYLVDSGCNVWNEDAYNYYIKLCKVQKLKRNISFEEFIHYIKQAKGLEELRDDSVGYSHLECPLIPKNYTLGDCGKQYGSLWREWEKIVYDENNRDWYNEDVDQLLELYLGLRNNSLGRRHIISAWNPSTLDQMALNACHALVQFNCRPIPWEEKLELAKRHPDVEMENLAITEAAAGNRDFGDVPQYYLDCQMYQRSADVFLGVPFNIASYALMTCILSQMLNMKAGDFVHSFGDAHIYDNHSDQTDLQLTREERKLPRLKLSDEFYDHLIKWREGDVYTFSEFLEGLQIDWFSVEGYDPHPHIKGKLSTGLK